MELMLKAHIRAYEEYRRGTEAETTPEAVGNSTEILEIKTSMDNPAYAQE
jgi:hypothetical protein